jgi:type IV pilus assembly protein PilC
MLKAGINLAEALDTLIDQTESPKLKDTLRHVLSSALDKFPSVFDQFYVNIVKIGEESGKLDQNLSYLSEKLIKELALRKEIKGAMLYPEIVVSATVILGLGLSIFVLPKLGSLFTSMNMKLPITTRMLLAVANFMEKDAIWVVIGLVALVILFPIFIRLKPIRPIWSKLMLSIPILGQFFTNVETATFCRNLGIMLSSSLPISQALEIAEKTTGNYVFKKYIAGLQKSVSEGKLIGDQLLEGKFPVLPMMAARMISVGEKSGKLNEMLIYIGDYYETETDNMTKNLSTIIEPILLLFIGLIVGTIALAIIQPIYQMTGSIPSG